MEMIEARNLSVLPDNRPDSRLCRKGNFAEERSSCPEFHSGLQQNILQTVTLDTVSCRKVCGVSLKAVHAQSVQGIVSHPL